MNEHGHFAVANGLRIYYETHGPDDKEVPVVLLHGGVGGIEMFGPNLPALARNRRVIAVDLPNHGRSANVDGVLRHASMADPIAALIEQLGVQQIDLIGYSLGGGVALQTTIRHPELVRTLVIVSSPFRRDAFYPEILAIFDQMGASFGTMMKQSPMATLYPERDWEQLFEKMGDLQRQDFDWSREVAKIRAPMMLIFADADTYRTEHIIDFYKLIGGGQRDAGLDGSRRSPNQLAIIPGTTHYNLLDTTTVADMVEKFLPR
ncbi:MAG: alpha/beta fold hydrolase [Gemmatimonadaceae bacterium]